LAGKFITLEGGEGGGKSTQAKLLKEALEARGHSVLLTREPGGSPGAEAIRALVVQGEAGRWDGMTEALLLNAARRDHVIKVIKPALNEGKIVISDRFSDSTIAYQGYGQGVNISALYDLQRASIGEFMPDLTLILDMPVEEGLKRADTRGGVEVRFESMAIEFHRRMQAGFHLIASRDSDRCYVINGHRLIEPIHADILAAVLKVVG